MFCECAQNNFTLSRGDTFIWPIIINQGTKLAPEEYELQVDDKLHVAIMEPNQSFENAVIRKSLDINSSRDSKGNILFQLQPEDTEYLQAGKYFITIKLKQQDGTVTTVLPMKEFWLTGTTKTLLTSQQCEDSPGEEHDTDIEIIYDGGIVE